MGLLPVNIASGGTTTGHKAHHDQVHAKLNDEVEIVRDFGADPTGVADSTSAILSAAAAAGDNGVLTAKPGQYKVSDQGAGVCLDFSAYSGFTLRGLGATQMNASATGQGAVFFRAQTGKKIMQFVASGSQEHLGPRLENFGIEDRGGNSDCLYVDSFLNGRMVNVRCKGFAGTTTGYGFRKVATLGDSSYWDIRDCQFHRNKFNYTSGSDVIEGCYFESLVNGATLLQVAAGTGDCRVAFNKFEANGHGASTIVGVQLDGLCHQVIANAFEGPTTMVSVVAQGSLTNTRHLIVGNEFTGSDGTETAVSIGSNNRNCQVVGGAYSNLTNDFVDSGTDTLIVGLRPDTGPGAGYRRFLYLAGMSIAGGSGAPLQNLPTGSLYMRSDGTGPNLYVFQNSAWRAVTAT